MPRCILVCNLLWISLTAVWPSGVLAAALAHHVPDGFVIEQVAGDPQTILPMFAAFDDRGRLFVAESSGLDLYAELNAQTRKCRVRLLEDQDGDGRFETSRVFADKLVYPMGLVWREGKLFVADPPDVVVFEDKNGDGQADERKVVLTGFGHKDNGSLHGLTFGPDGWLYMTLGHPDGYRLKRDDGSVLSGEGGALLRCRADGSRPEVVCRGFENLVEVVFLPTGEVIGTDNWFQRPSGGVRDALVHLVEGGLYPLNSDKGTRFPATGEPLPAIALFPAVALSGMTLYRGEAFPNAMQGNLFTAQHNARKVGRHALVREGSTFRAESFDFVTSDDPDFHPADVLESADGSLLVIDTGGWYVQHCPTGKIRNSQSPGGIYRVRYANAARSRDPWGLSIRWDKLSLKELCALLADRRPAVRDKAQQHLSARGDASVKPLTEFLSDGAEVTSKQQAVWTLNSILSPAATEVLRSILPSDTSELIIPAASALALRGDRPSATALGRLLTDKSEHVRLAAAGALAHCGDATALPAIWAALATKPDRFLEHALIHAAYRTANESSLQTALEHPHPGVQKAALLLLDQPPHERLFAAQVLARVSVADADLRRTAVATLRRHSEWAEPAVGFIQTSLEGANFAAVETAGLRDLILAFQSHARLQQVIGGILEKPAAQNADDLYRFLLEMMADTSLSRLPSAWVTGLSRAIELGSPAVRSRAVRTGSVLQVPQLDDALARIAEDTTASAELRMEALRGVVLRRPRLSPVGFELLLTQISPAANPAARLTAAEVLGRTELTEMQVKAMLPAVRRDPLVSPAVLLPALLLSRGESVRAVFDYLAEAVQSGWHPAERDSEKMRAWIPDMLRNELDALLKSLEQRVTNQRSRLAALEPLLRGGDAERGRAVFFGGKVACSTCHRIGDQGGWVGPDLTKIGAIRAGRDLLESIVLPSSTFAQGYESYLAMTSDGQQFDGILARQTVEALTLRDASGAEVLLRKDRIKELKRKEISIMPEGLDGAMSPDEFRDLLAFLQSLK